MSAEERAAYFEKMPSALCVIDIPKGAMLTKEGDVRDEAYLLLKGELATTDYPDEKMKPGTVSVSSTVQYDI